MHVRLLLICMILKLMISMIMSKKKFFKVILTVVKYGITLLLGYLGGSSDSN